MTATTMKNKIIKCQDQAQARTVNAGNDSHMNKVQPKWEVQSWEIIFDAKKEAMEMAEKDGGISCSEYLKSRKSSSLEALRKCPPKEAKTKKMALPENIPKLDMQVNLNIQSEYSHGDKKAKSLRSKIFAKWILDKFGADYLKHGSGVLDIAGGKGQLSVELAVMGQILCHVVDPLLRKRGTNVLSKKQVKRIDKANGQLPIHVAKAFDSDKFVGGDESRSLVLGANCLIGLHPDECTEDILDVALRFEKSVAIVPCCVFPTRIFPMRQLRSSGKPVRSYDEFLQYLLEKDERLRMEALDFEGRNHVIYLKQQLHVNL